MCSRGAALPGDGAELAKHYGTDIQGCPVLSEWGAAVHVLRTAQLEKVLN